MLREEEAMFLAADDVHDLVGGDLGEGVEVQRRGEGVGQTLRVQGQVVAVAAAGLDQGDLGGMKKGLFSDGVWFEGRFSRAKSKKENLSKQVFEYEKKTIYFDFRALLTCFALNEGLRNLRYKQPD